MAWKYLESIIITRAYFLDMQNKYLQITSEKERKKKDDQPNRKPIDDPTNSHSPSQLVPAVQAHLPIEGMKGQMMYL